jgi:phage tail-like protein
VVYLICLSYSKSLHQIRILDLSTNPDAIDPYKKNKFRVKWDGKYVVGVSKISPLKRTTEVMKLREGNDPSTERKLPGRTTCDTIVIERGITRDREFEDWAKQVWSYGSSPDVPPKDFQKDITIEVLNENGQTVIVYKVYRCWVSEYVVVPDIDPNSNAVAVEHLKLENEGWECDEKTVEPNEPPEKL